MAHSGLNNLEARARLLKILGHPVRLALLAELVRGPKCVTNIRDLLKVRQPNVSQHLAVLRQAELVDYHEEGNLRCYYILRPALVRDLMRFIKYDYSVEPQTAAQIRTAALENTLCRVPKQDRYCQEFKNEKKSRLTITGDDYA